MSARSVSVFLLPVLFAPQLTFAAELQVTPAELQFEDAYSRTQLLISSDSTDVTRQVQYEIADQQIATIDADGFVTPVGVGTTELKIIHGAETKSIPIRVTAFNHTRQIDFATEIEPLLTRYGCNSGGCHGKASGQNGFKLSLLGFDTEFDYETLVNESRGRRLFPLAPRQSMLLRKATGETPHGGGQRFEADSEPYQMLLSWIESGSPASSPDVARSVSIRIEPPESILTQHGHQQLRAIAVYSDGRERDVTRQAEFSSNMDIIARVSEEGYVEATGQSGEATIMSRYRGHVSIFRAIIPHGQPLEAIPEFAPITQIDSLAVEKWKKLGIRPSPSADDATFLRRLTLDLCGRLATPDETRAFLNDESADKRDRLIERLLESPDYSAYFALKWGVILRNSRLAAADQAAYAFHNWIRDSIARNKPYDEFVRGIVAASGEWQDAPAINWFWQARDDQLHTITADTAQLFLGIRLQCARCHHHPYEKWGQEDYYGLAGFYTRLGRKSFGQPPPYYSAGRVTLGEKNPLTGQSPEPKYPGGEYATFTPEDDPRQSLVDWMSEPENPFFAKAFVNRMWGHFFGRGLVDEVDDMRATNPASHPEILDYLAQDFSDHHFDMKHVIRQIVRSRMYQLSSEPQPDNQYDQQNFARFYARRMIAEVLHDSIDELCGTETRFSNMAQDARAIDLPHEGFGSYMLDTFDRPKRVTVCECERSTGATLAQVLLLSNSDEIENKIADGKGRIAKHFEQQHPPAEIVEDLYLAAYSRFPAESERQVALDYIERREKPDDQRKAVEDLLWTLLNSKEFAYNH